MKAPAALSYCLQHLTPAHTHVIPQTRHTTAAFSFQELNMNREHRSPAEHAARCIQAAAVQVCQVVYVPASAPQGPFTGTAQLDVTFKGRLIFKPK